MLCEEMTAEQVSSFLRELIATVRDIHRRCDELKIIHSMPSCPQDMKLEIADRFKRLSDAKFSIIYSIYDVKAQFHRVIGEERSKRILGTVELYQELKEI